MGALNNQQAFYLSDLGQGGWGSDGGPHGDASRKMGKGVTLSKEELLALKELLNKIEL